MEKRIILLIVAVVSATWLLAGPVIAQTNDEINASFQFNLSSPGARSLALGGAFVGLADDATAAYTNPAGLLQLSKPEVSVEGRHWGYTNVFSDAGNVFRTSLGFPSGFDATDTLVEGRMSTSVEEASFLSFVYPKKRWAFAVYRHVLADFQSETLTQGVILGDLNNPLNPLNRISPVGALLDLSVVNLGVAFAFEISEDLAIGVGLSYYDFSIESITVRFPTLGDFLDTPPDYSRVSSISQQKGGDSDVGFNVGLLWTASEAVRLGAVYRTGPALNYLVEQGSTSQSATFDIPDVLGIGVAVTPSDPVTLTMEYDRVFYSDLTDTFRIVADSELPLVPEDYAIEDGNEFHLGFEYLFLEMKHPVALRVGGWFDPDHRIRYGGTDRIERTLFRPGTDELHISFGLGVSISPRLQVDVAADFSDLVDTVSLSGVYRF